jgi:hypothetical protein
MSALLSPIISEFETLEAENAYDVWYREKITKSMNSNQPLIPHDQVKAEIRKMLEERRKLKNGH